MHVSQVPSRALLAASGPLFFASSVVAQCQLEWQPGQPAAGPAGSVLSLTELGNGDLVAAGGFSVAGAEVANNIARYDGNSWHAIGAGTDGTIRDVALLPNGDLFVVGSFANAGGLPAANAAIWNGSSWIQPGAGLNDTATGAVVLPSGAVAVVGEFDSASGTPAAGLAVWNGIGWLGLPATGHWALQTVVLDGDGDLLVAGNAAPNSADIVRWNGTGWSALPGILASSILEVSKLLTFPNGDLLVSGSMFIGGRSTTLARYDGAQLIDLVPPAFLGAINPPLAIDANGDVLLGNALNGTANPVAYRFDGVQWQPLGQPGSPRVREVLSLRNGSIAIGRGPSPAGNSFDPSVSIFSAGSWTDAGNAPGFNAGVTQLMPNGDVVVGGFFSEIGGVAANSIARWDGSSWHALAQGVDGEVSALGVAPDGTLLVAGNFFAAGGALATRVARWNGSSWSTLGSGVPSARALSIAENAAGEIVVVTASAPRAHYFDGQSWTTPSLPLGAPAQVLVLPSDEFLLLGNFVDLSQVPPTGSAGVRFFAGTATIDSGLVGMFARNGRFGPDGDLWISTTVNSLNGIARVVGGAAQLVPTGQMNGAVAAFDFLPNGDLLVAGDFTEVGQQPVGGVFRWDGSSIDDLSGGVASGSVRSLAVGGHGDVFMSGRFQSVAGGVSIDLARARTTCPAQVISFGVGCSGAAGPVTLATDELPWIGATWNATAAGMTPASLAVHCIGDTGAVAPLPLGAAGCSLFVNPLLLELLVPQSGTANVAVALPAVPALIGGDVFSQVVGLELDQSMALLQTTSTNALQLTVGAL